METEFYNNMKMKIIFILTILFNFAKTLTMKRICKNLAVFAAATLFSSVVFAKPLNIVTTIFPSYDWAKNVALGTDAKITMLLGNGADMHSFQPSVKDIAKISSSDVFIFVGGESDEWALDAIRMARNKNLLVVNFMEVLKNETLQEELKEGMQAEEEEIEKEDDEDIEYDEHVWLSLRKAQKLVSAICDAFSAANPENAAVYKTNTGKYNASLKTLDEEFVKAMKDAKNKTLVFGDRFPFRYFVEDYGLDYYAAFVGCSAETEASFNTIIFLAKKMDSLALKNIFVIDKSDQKIAKTIVRNSKSKNAGILMLDSLQSTSLEDAQKGASYISIMRKNLVELKKAL